MSNAILYQFQQQNSQATVLLGERKSAPNALYIYVIFVGCYLPIFCCLVLQSASYSSGSILATPEVTVFFVLLNSPLNPFSLLLAVSIGSSHYEEHFKENFQCSRRIISYDARVPFIFKHF